jgi:hypothetical protein
LCIARFSARWMTGAAVQSQRGAAAATRLRARAGQAVGADALPLHRDRRVPARHRQPRQHLLHRRRGHDRAGAPAPLARAHLRRSATRPRSSRRAGPLGARPVASGAALSGLGQVVRRSLQRCVHGAGRPRRSRRCMRGASSGLCMAVLLLGFCAVQVQPMLTARLAASSRPGTWGSWTRGRRRAVGFRVYSLTLPYPGGRAGQGAGQGQGPVLGRGQGRQRRAVAGRAARHAARAQPRVQPLRRARALPGRVRRLPCDYPNSVCRA